MIFNQICLSCPCNYAVQGDDFNQCDRIYNAAFRPLGRVFKVYIYLSIAQKIPPQPPLKRGENERQSPPF